MILIKRFTYSFVFLLFKLNSNDTQSSAISTISLPESYVSQKKHPKPQKTNKIEEKKSYKQIQSNKKNNNKIILGGVGIIIIFGIIYLIKSN